MNIYGNIDPINPISFILCLFSAEDVTFELIVLDGSRVVRVHNFEERIDEFSLD